MLIGLAAKNAILIVEFAKQLEDQGRDRFAAAVEAARLRLAPILMTSFAFIFGVMPLVWAIGAGAELRQTLGTAVFAGMIGVTAFGLIFTPVFYVVCRWVAEKTRRRRHAAASAARARGSRRANAADQIRFWRSGHAQRGRRAPPRRRPLRRRPCPRWRAARGGPALAPCACALSHHRRCQSRGDAGRARWCSPASDTAELGDLPCQGAIPDTEVTVPPYPILAREEVRHVGDAVAFVVADTLDQARDAAEAIAIEWERAAARDRGRRRVGAGRAAGVAATIAPAAISRSRPSSATPRRPRGLRRGGAHACRSRSSTSGSSPTISTPAASSPSTTRQRSHHADARQPGQPRRPRHAVHGRVQDRARQDAGRDPRCRRRLRHQALSLPRICARGRGGAAPRAAGEMGRRPQRAFPRRRAGPRQRHDGEARARRQWAFPRPRRRPRRRHGRLSVLLRAVHSVHRRRHVARRLRHSGLPCARARGLHQYGAGRCLSRRRASGGGLCDRAPGRRCRARDRRRARRAAAEELHQGRCPTRPRPARPTIPASSPATCARAQESADWKGFERRLAQSRKAGRLRGIGIATYIEACGNNGPDTARVRLDGDGGVTVLVGTQSTGQGHATAYAQIVAEHCGLPPEPRTVVQGDTDLIATGTGTGGSSSIPCGGASVAGAARKLAEHAQGDSPPTRSKRPRAISKSPKAARARCRHRPCDRVRRSRPPSRGAPARRSRPRTHSCRRRRPIPTAPISPRSRSTRTPAQRVS